MIIRPRKATLLIALVALVWILVKYLPGFRLITVSILKESLDSNLHSLRATPESPRTFHRAGDPDARISVPLLDTSGTYLVYPSVSEGSKFTSGNPLTLVTHCSLKHLQYLSNLTRRWQAPISVTVFVRVGEMEETRMYLKNLRECDEGLQAFVSFHLVTPLTNSSINEFTRNDVVTSDNYQKECKSVTVDGLLASRKASGQNYDIEVPYPNNLLRNIGRRFSKSEYVLVIDIDMMPSKDLHAQFSALLKTRNRPAWEEPPPEVFVVPAFEIDDSSVSVPENKAQLLNLLSHLKVRPFYFEMCWKCQQPTDFGAWEKTLISKNVDGKDVMEVAYHVLWKDPWEPFFIAHRRAPLYDERFKQYGFNRISQACELHVAGYKFSVLSTAFVVHLGFKTSRTFHRTKAEDLTRNRQLFARFKQELGEKYPESDRQCW